MGIKPVQPGEIPALHRFPFLEKLFEAAPLLISC
jgi:hypothetical protein